MLELCAHVANASKHFDWGDNGRVRRMEKNPDPSNWYQFFTYIPAPGIYVEIGGCLYSLAQIARVIPDFYGGLLARLGRGVSTD
jgi:hypothetical protein